MSQPVEIVVVPKSEIESLRDEIKGMRAAMEEFIQGFQFREEYLTTEEACDRFKVSQTTLFERKRKGHIAPMQTGKVIRWPVSELNKLFSKRK